MTSSNQHFWTFILGGLSKSLWHDFFFEIGRDVERIEVLEVLSWRICGAEPPLGKGRFFKDSIHPHVDQYLKIRERLIVTRILLNIPKQKIAYNPSIQKNSLEPNILPHIICSSKMVDRLKSILSHQVLNGVNPFKLKNPYIYRNISKYPKSTIYRKS